MKKNKGFTVSTMILAGAATVLLILGGIGGARAALQFTSEIYEVPLAMEEIGIGILENGEARDFDTLLLDLIDEENGEEIKPGVVYDENVDVTNNGEIDEYIRVIVYKYWLDAEDGDKVTTLNPDLILLEDPVKHGWFNDEAQSTSERDVYYYSKPVKKNEVLDLFDTIEIDEKIVDMVYQKEDPDNKGNLITTNIYDGKYFGIKVEAAGVQTHNAEDAIHSAWGAEVDISGNGTLSLSE